MTPNLAIVLPAYKSEFLQKTLQSICNQTDQRFILYIFDDASPHNIEQITQQVSFDCKVKFKRFKRNLGKRSLTQQWERCIGETAEEDWIWLFSDDDIMTPDCVESFYKTVNVNPGFSAYRFNTKKVSVNGKVIKENEFPEILDGAEFLNNKLSYKEESYIVEYVFSRRAYQEIDGFPDLPLAWTADDLFCLKLAQHGGICSIKGGSVHWRYSDSNISGRKNRKNALLKVNAALEFVDWIMEKPNITQKLKPRELPITWYIRQIRSMLDQLTLIDQLKAVQSVSHHDKGAWIHYFRMKKNRSKIYGWLKKFSS
ncbi:MAG: glycosyltransferase [Balneolaceae bacterium]|nr:glycosyltransferase [Balneolaceae bacterium]